jgi:hypothetical protein
MVDLWLTDEDESRWSELVVDDKEPRSRPCLQYIKAIDRQDGMVVPLIDSLRPTQ